MVNGKQYVGKAFQSFNQRYGQGKWWKKTENKYLKNSIKKYGKNNFTLSILEYSVTSTELLGDLEEKYIKELKTQIPNGYNVLKGGNDKNQLAIANQKSFTLYNHKTETIISSINICKFCRENNLDRATLERVISGAVKSHKEWTLPKTKMRKWLVISPSGEQYKILDGEVFGFCKKFDLTPTNFGKMLNLKNRRHHQGWRLVDSPVEKRVLKSPNGEFFTLEFGKISDFCNKNNLIATMIFCVFNKSVKQHRGWSLPETKLEHYAFRDVNGNEYKTMEGLIYDFSRKYKLSLHSLIKLHNKEINDYKGWTRA